MDIGLGSIQRIPGSWDLSKTNKFVPPFGPFSTFLLSFCSCKCDSGMLLWQIGIDWSLG